MKLTQLLSFLAVSALLSGSVLANDVAVGDVLIKDVWVRGTVAGQKATGAFMTLSSAKGAVIIGGASPIAGAVEIHETLKDGEVMRMRQVKSLPVLAGQARELKPGSHHVMLMELKQTLKEGDSVPLTLRFEQDGTTQEATVNAPVRALGSAPMKH
uniref:Copper chaperone PCu(A)C n=1 Tax=uncultured prokaryote AT3 TaxID=672202 RepID=D3W8F3_9ZZZZ|nr:hypothetical protein [uncultured prokaryote AT3]